MGENFRVKSTNVLWIRNCRQKCLWAVGGQLADTAGYALGGRCVCIHQMAALMCVRWRHGRYLESMMSCQIGAYLKYFNNPAKFHPDPIWNNGSTLDRRSNNRKNQNNEMSSDIWYQFLTKNAVIFVLYRVVQKLRHKSFCHPWLRQLSCSLADVLCNK